MKVFLVGVWWLALLCGQVGAQSVKTGTTIAVPGWTLVLVIGSEPVRNATRTFSNSDTCIVNGGQVQVIPRVNGSVAGLVSVRYVNPAPAMIRQCPTGAFLAVPPTWFRDADATPQGTKKK